MNKVEIINGVTKRFLGDKITYLFPVANIFVDTVSGSIQFQFESQPLVSDSVLFADLSENFGTADAESYVDYLATNGFFFEIGEGTGSGTIETSTIITDLTRFERQTISSLSNIAEELKNIKDILTSIAD